METITYSILIPAYKAKYLEEAISSCLCQTYSFFEIIVVDDCSPDNLKAIIDTFDDERIRYFRNKKNCGAINVVENWNKCLAYSRGEYTLCMGDDDRLMSNCLSDLNNLINKYPKLNVYHIQTRIIDENGDIKRELEKRPEFETADRMLFERFNGRSQYIGDFCFRANKLKEQGGFFYLPLAWTSDDITAFRAAFPDGIANTNSTGFEYRENRDTISENNTNHGLKIEALRLSEQWYNNFFTTLPFDNRIEEVKNAMVYRYSQLYNNHIYGDIINKPLRFFYWFFHSRDLHISIYSLIKIAGKCIKDSV